MKTVVETIKERLPITEVLSSYITVQQSGNQFKAKCPFHNERTPSFYISADRGLYYCFGCGAKGDIFSFVEQFEGLDFKGTLKLLAERAGVSITKNEGSYSDIDPVYEILEKATVLYQDILSKNNSAQEYLLKRGLLKETIDSFRIGYVPDDWRTIESLCKTDSEKEVAIRAGLIKKTEDKLYDRFRKRILFPLMDSSGRVVGFSGRNFPEDDKGPKYLNSPETELFQKSKLLFGFDKAKFHIKKHNFAILVEGQMDLVISHQAGFRNTVASSGTAVSEDSAQDPFSNLSVLSRLTPNLFLAFDGDKAGQSAMDRAALVALSLGMNPKVVVLPGGVDPAEFIKEKGVESWKEKLKESKHFIEHHLTIIKGQSQSPHTFVRNIKEKLFPFLARVASPIEKNLYIRMISAEIGISEETIIEELSKVISNTIVQNPVKENINPSLESTPYERLTALRKCFDSPKIEQVVESLNTLSVGDILFSAPSLPEDRLDRALILVEREYSNISEQDRVRVAEELVAKITEIFLTTIRSDYSLKLKQAESKGDEIETERLSGLIQEINKRIHERSSA
jgi:DNA primase